MSKYRILSADLATQSEQQLRKICKCNEVNIIDNPLLISLSAEQHKLPPQLSAVLDNLAFEDHFELLKRLETDDDNDIYKTVEEIAKELLDTTNP